VVEKIVLEDAIKKLGWHPAQLRMAFNPVATPEDPNGNALTAHQLAKRLARDLRNVQPAGKKVKDPLGWVVVVNLDVTGLKDVPLLLTWSLDGVNVPDSWAADNIAYRLTAATDHDSGSVNVWVPRLRKKGMYNVNVEVDREDDGTVLTQGEPLGLP